MASESKNSSVKILRGKVDSLTLYEVTESELRDLEKGGPVSLFLNFAISLFSICISFFISLFTTTIESQRIFCVFVIVTSIALIGAIAFFVIWFVFRKRTSNIILTIKKRMPSDELTDLDAEQDDAVTRA